MSRPVHLLLVLRRPGAAEPIVDALRGGGFEPAVETIGDEAAMRAALALGACDLVLCDEGPVACDVLTALALIREFDAPVPLVVVTAALAVEDAAELMRRGAADLVLKDHVPTHLASSVRRALAEAQARRRAAWRAQRRRDIAELAGDWIWETDAAHRISFFAGQHAGGDVVPVAAVLHYAWWELADPAEAGAAARLMAELDARRPFRGFRITVPGPAGARLRLACSGKPVFDERGRFTGYRGIAVDDSEAASGWHAMPIPAS